MNANNSNDQEMERLLEEHFASGADNVPPPPNFWVLLEGRLGDQTPRPLWAGLRDWAFPVQGFRGASALATTAAAVAVVGVVVVVAIAGSIWFVGGGNGGGIPAAPEPLATPMPYATPTPMTESRTPLSATAAPAAATAAPVVPIPYATPTPMAMMEAPTPFPPGATAAPLPATAMPHSPTATPFPGWRLVPGGATPQSEQRHSSGQPGATTFEDYARQHLTDALEDGVSTFSLDTDRTSFQLALNWARSGYQVDPASVRAEEWVNAFDYGYAAPSASDRFAITSDLLVHPLDSGRYMARVAFKAPKVITDAPLNVTLVLDASGSMSNGNRVAIAREAADAIRRSLDRDDRVSVVHFTTDVLHDLTVQYAAPDDRAVTDSIARLAPHDSTNVQAGLDLGVRLADKMRQERPEALNYIVLMSDGVANVDATDPFAILEATSAQSGANPLRIITVGVGIENYNDHLLEQLAQHGNGWYRYLFDVEQARSTFRRENWLALASPVADQTRAQVVWNPEAVRAWRIVGYENRVTSAASFTQDRQEFAEVYSGAATTVFYELELHDDFRQKGGLGQVELRWVAPESGRAWSQSSDLVSSGAVVRPHEDPLLQFGAIVALTADRYSALGGSPESYRGYAQDLWSLRDRTVDLQGDLSHLDAFKDFAYVLETLLMSVPYASAEDSGYSR